MMHAAQIDRSPRLQRVLAVLKDGAEHSTRELLAAAHVCAVNSIVAELRANHYPVSCRQVRGEGGRVWLYRLARVGDVSTGPDTHCPQPARRRAESDG